MASESVVATLAGVIGAGGLTAIFMAFINRRKTNAEGRNIEIEGELRIANAAAGLVELQKKEIERLLGRIEIQEKKITELYGKQDELCAANMELESQNRCLKDENEDFKLELAAYKKT